MKIFSSDTNIYLVIFPLKLIWTSEYRKIYFVDTQQTHAKMKNKTKFSKLTKIKRKFLKHLNINLKKKNIKRMWKYQIFRITKVTKKKRKI